MMMPDEICRHLREAAAAIRSVRNGESRDHLGEIHAHACENGAKEIEKLSDMLAANLQIEGFIELKRKLEWLELELEDARKCADMWKIDHDHLETGLREVMRVTEDALDRSLAAAHNTETAVAPRSSIG